MASEDGENVLPASKKLFINHVDTYQGLNLAKVQLLVYNNSHNVRLMYVWSRYGHVCMYL